MKNAEDFIPWKVTDISLRPHEAMWSFNASMHYDGQIWRCVLRCSDYCMRGGVTIRSDNAQPGETQTKNVMVIFDSVSWRPLELYKIRERDGLPRVPCQSVGYEDIRIFRTDSGGLQGIAASLHLRRSDANTRGGVLKQPAEQVLLSFDDKYNIVEAQPIRGFWSETAQKNWAPFDNCADPRFLYSIEDGKLFDAQGEMSLGTVHPSVRPRKRLPEPDERSVRRAQKRAAESEAEREREERKRAKRDRKECNTKTLRSVRDPQQTYEGLRGGSQLVRVDDDSWLGIGHAMKFIDGLKFYFHVWYLVDSRGKIKAASQPMKLAPNNGIEFAAGMAIDGERVVVSFGVDDMNCFLGETRLSAVRGILRSIQPSP